MSYSICLECGKEFRKSRLHRKFCCENCRKIYTRNTRKKTYKTIKCPICNTSFKPKSSTNKYCSKKCCIKYHNGLKKRKFIINTKVCKICGNNFLAKHFNNTCCSESCKKEASNIAKRRSYFKYREKMIEKHKIYNNKNKEKMAKYFKQYRKDNLEKKVKYEKEYYKKNRKKILNLCAEYTAKNKEKKRATTKRWYLKNIEKVREYHRNRQRSNPDLIVKRNIRRQIHRGVKNKNFTTFELLDYSGEDLRLHLESKFKENMSWKNYGIKGWHIDHIKPISSFKFIKENGEQDLEQIKLCWSLNNLQPLWAEENINKRNWYEVDGKMCRFSNGEIIDTIGVINDNN